MTNSKLKSKDKRKSLARSRKKSESINFIRSLIKDKSLKKGVKDKSLKKGVKDDAYPIQGRFFVYKYDEVIDSQR